MKRIVQIFAVVLLFAVFKESEVFAQSSGGGWLIDTPIIPVTSGIWWGFTDSVRYPGAMNKMRAVVDGIDLDLGWVDGKPWGGTIDSQMDTLINHYGFHVTPAAVYNKNNSTLYNWVEIIQMPVTQSGKQKVNLGIRAIYNIILMLWKKTMMATNIYKIITKCSMRGKRISVGSLLFTVRV